MIGPGTGVAPFRGFVQERSVVAATGRNWLLFGNPHARSDFLYQIEWQDALKRGELHRLDLAFSRDQAHKVYVQDKLREHGRTCSTGCKAAAPLRRATPRACQGVHAALLDGIATHGGKSRRRQRLLNDLNRRSVIRGTCTEMSSHSVEDINTAASARHAGQSLSNRVTGALADDDQTLIKYPAATADDRDVRDERAGRSSSRLLVLIRTRTPARVTPAQWLKLEAIATTFATRPRSPPASLPVPRRDQGQLSRRCRRSTPR